MENLIILGTGKSVYNCIEKGLFESIFDQDIFALNNFYEFMPYYPDAIVWTDFIPFFLGYQKELLSFIEKDVELIARELGTVYKDFKITTYKTTWFKNKAKGNYLYTGKDSLSGMFALSIGIKRNYKNIFLFGFDSKGDNKDYLYFKDKANIYNVSKDSTIDIFKKIDMKEFRELIKV